MSVLTVTLEDVKGRIPSDKDAEAVFAEICAAKSQFELFMSCMNNGVYITSEEAMQVNSELQEKKAKGEL